MMATPTSERCFHGFGVHAAFDGHDLHGLTVGPTKLYFSVSDNGFSVRTLEGRLLHHPNTGGVLCNWDGSGLEVFATGLRNVQELAFDDFGNLFSVDNDGDIREERGGSSTSPREAIQAAFELAIQKRRLAPAHPDTGVLSVDR